MQMKGLAITNSPLLRQAHNSLARYVRFSSPPNTCVLTQFRPADLRGSLSSIAVTTIDQAKAKAKPKTKAARASRRDTKPSPTKRAKTSHSSSPAKQTNTEEDGSETEDAEEVYHFIGYVPAHGKVWELDGLKSGPLEVGELSNPLQTVPAVGKSPSEMSSNSAGWMDVVRPALRMKMEKYGGAAEGGSNIRFSLLAIVDGLYEKASDELELFKRELRALERRLDAGWEEQVCSFFFLPSKS